MSKGSIARVGGTGSFSARTIALAIVTACGAGLWYWGAHAARPPGPPRSETLRAAIIAPHALVYRTPEGRLEYECFCALPVKFVELSGAFVKVLVGVEDRRFWDHQGIDWRAIARAAYVNGISGETRQGASTLAQQLVKMKLLGPERTFGRKVKEAFLAREISSILTKEELLAAYANAAWFGRGIVGVEAAARHFFAKSAKDLNLWESAVLVGMLKAPAHYNPTHNPGASAERARLVLAALVRHGSIAEGTMRDAILAGAQPGAQRAARVEVRWYLDAVRKELERFRLEPQPGDGPLRAALFLDVNQQAIAQSLVAEAAPHHLSAIVASELDGRVRAVVGGHDYAARQWNLALQEKRQAASLAKLPAAAVALRNGFSPASKILDAPVNGAWPRNGNRPHSLVPVTIGHAFTHSLNAPFAQLITKRVEGGVVRMRGLIRVCGSDLSVPEVPSIATGAFDLTPWQAATMIASFATGRCVAPRTIAALTTMQGEIVYAGEIEPGRALLPSHTVEDLNRLMLDVVERGTGRAAKLPGVPVRGKTGTSSDDRHAWFAGYGEGGPLSVHWVGAHPEGAGVTAGDAARQFRGFQSTIERRRLWPPAPPRRPDYFVPGGRGPAVVMRPDRRGS